MIDAPNFDDANYYWFAQPNEALFFLEEDSSNDEARQSTESSVDIEDGDAIQLV